MHYAISVQKDRVLFVSFDFQFPLCWQQRLKYEQAVRLVYPPFFCKLRLSSEPTKKKKKEAKLGLEIQSAPCG
jgi:hypothetical protein